MQDIKQLHPELQAIIARFLSACSAQGIHIKIKECLRTAVEQDYIYAQGRTRPGTKVTNARGSSYQSQHQWGIAFDICLNMDVDGDGYVSDDAYNDSKSTFESTAKIGKQLGLSWGGDWTSIKDRPHFYLGKFSPDGTTAYLKRTYGTPDKFFKTWIAGVVMVKSDTTCDVSIKRGAYYTAKFSGADNISVTAGTGGVATIVVFTRGADKLAAIVPIGKVGDSTGIYTTVPGGQPVKQFKVKIS